MPKNLTFTQVRVIIRIEKKNARNFNFNFILLGVKVFFNLKFIKEATQGDTEKEKCLEINFRVK